MWSERVFSGDFIPNVFLLTFPLAFSANSLQLFKSKCFEKLVMYLKHSSHLPFRLRVAQVQNPWSDSSLLEMKGMRSVCMRVSVIDDSTLPL